MRRLLYVSTTVAVAVAAASVFARAHAQAQPPQPPTFRAGAELVQVDAIVSDSSNKPITDLTQDDFAVTDDGVAVPITAFRFVKASSPDWHDEVVAPIRNVDDERREASREGVRILALFLDEFHVESHDVLRVLPSLVEFVTHLPPGDLLAVYGPWDSVLDVRYTRDREQALKRVRAFEGRHGPHVMGRYPLDEDIRLQISSSTIEGIVTHIGGIGEGRKSVIVVTEDLQPGGGGGFNGAMTYLTDLIRSANRNNVALYPFDPAGLTGVANVESDMARSLAVETGGLAMINRNDYGNMLAQVSRDASAYYLLGYVPTHAADGKFHKIAVHVKRRGVSVRARSGYLAPTAAEAAERSALQVETKPEVKSALDSLASATRPDAAEAAPSKPAPAPAAADGPIAEPTLAVMAGRVVGEPVARREFARTERLVVRAAITKGAPVVTARLLSRLGQPLTDLPVKIVGDRCELTVALGMLGPGEYLIELTGVAGDLKVQRHVAFRVVAR